MAEYAIEVENLTKVYGELRAVDDISFKVRKGEVFAFLGPNGAGKTTTVEIIEGIRSASKGRIKIFGNSLKGDKDRIKEIIGVLPQEFESFERLTVRETLIYFQRLYKKRADVDELINLVDLEDKRDALYMNLSGGLKRRLSVAIAIVNDPEIVFLDEPTTGLDPKARRDVWSIIDGLKGKGKTIFLTTHYMEEAEYLADSVAIIHRGKIIATGSPEELIENYGRTNTLVIKGSDVDKVSSAIKPLELKVDLGRDSDVLIRIVNKNAILDVLNILKEENIEYRELDIKRPNLEEVFLNLTGTTLIEGADET